MAQEQTAYAGDAIKVLVNVIDSTGSHVAATINTTTTRIDGNSAAPTVTTVATGIYQITFSGVTPAPAEGDRLTVKVNGDIGGTAWSEYGIPVKIVADERGTDNVVVPTSDITAIKAKTDQLAFTVANQVDANALTGGGGDDAATIYSYFISGSNEDAFKADVSGLATAASISGLNDLSQADVRSAVGLASANLDTQLADLPTVSEFEARTLIAAAYFDPTADTVTTDAASRTASQADVSALATAASISALNDFDPATEQVVASNMRGTDGANTVAPVDVSSDVTAIKAKTDQLAFTVTNQVDANALTGGGGVDVSSEVAAIKAKTDQLAFTVANQVDANALTGGGEPIGSGAISHEVTVTVGGSPVDGAEVWVSTDSSGNNVVAGTLTTDAFGKATFMLDAGSYYLWAQRSGVNFPNPSSFTVS